MRDGGQTFLQMLMASLYFWKFGKQKSTFIINVGILIEEFFRSQAVFFKCGQKRVEEEKEISHRKSNF